MPQRSHKDKVFREKKILKTPIKFKLQLNDEQKLAKEEILNNTLTILAGSAGSGKTLLACQVALDGLFRKEYEKVIITRPTVSKEDIGFLPGDLKEKMDPWLAPIYHNLYMLYNKEKVDKHLENEDIEIVPFAFMRGRTFTDTFIIVDEAQNVTHSQMETVIGRLGKGSIMVICGDMGQIDLKDKRESGFSFLSRLEEQVDGFKTITLEKNHRHSIVSPILGVYQKFRD